MSESLRSKDASLVAPSDPEELKRVRERFMKTTLDLTQKDTALDAARNEVMGKMRGVHGKSRVTAREVILSRSEGTTKHGDPARTQS